MKITKQQLEQIIKEEIVSLVEIDAGEEMKQRIAASQAERGFEASPTGTPSPQAEDDVDPGLVNDVALRLGQQIEEFRNQLREPRKYGGKAEPVNLSADQAKAIFLAAIAQL